MNPVTILIGVILCAYAASVLILRLKGREERFRKLGAMRNFWGPRLGSAIHYVGYVVVPFGFGVALIFAGWTGVNVFEVFK
jgi:hypothetical protein